MASTQRRKPRSPLLMHWLARAKNFNGKSVKIFFFTISCLAQHPVALKPLTRYSLTLHTRPDKDSCDLKSINNSESTYGTTQFYLAEGSESASVNCFFHYLLFLMSDLIGMPVINLVALDDGVQQHWFEHQFCFIERLYLSTFASVKTFKKCLLWVFFLMPIIMSTFQSSS